MPSLVVWGPHLENSAAHGANIWVTYRWAAYKTKFLRSRFAAVTRESSELVHLLFTPNLTSDQNFPICLFLPIF